MSAPPFSAALAFANNVGIPPIEIFASQAGAVLAGDGTTDDSTAIMAAHSAAYAAGVREVWCAKQYYAPNAYNLGNVIFRGPGALIGTYRKKVVPLSARALVGLPSDIIPERDLRRFAKAISPSVVIQGDSTGTYNAAHINSSELLWAMLLRIIYRDNPGITVVDTNRSIGGTTIAQFNQAGTVLQGTGITLPNWFTNAAAPWSGYIANLSPLPDLMFINFNANAGSSVTATSMQAVVTYYQGLAKAPDIIFLTGNDRGTQSDIGSAMIAALEAVDQGAGAIRSFCEYYGFGMIDLHRAGCILRDGFDPCSQIMTQQPSANGSYSLPATLPNTQSDFDLTFTIDNTSGAAFGSSQHLALTLSPLSGNWLQIQQSGTVFQIVGQAGGGISWATFLTAQTVLQAVNTIQVAVRGNYISIFFNPQLTNTPIPDFKGKFLRQGGQFQPAVSYVVGSGAAAIVLTNYVTSSPSLCAPALTDAEMYGVSPYPQGGNGAAGDNHPASPCYATIHDFVLASVRLGQASAGRPTQAITVAGAINPEASLVTLVGPASGTYAITLAAPRVQDQGKLIAIEMLSTTGTNTVTLALTNVAGGTASNTCTWGVAAQKLLLIGCSTKWEVIKQDGVMLV